jgi:hypothetical protein
MEYYNVQLIGDTFEMFSLTDEHVQKLLNEYKDDPMGLLYEISEEGESLYLLATRVDIDNNYFSFEDYKESDCEMNINKNLEESQYNGWIAFLPTEGWLSYKTYGGPETDKDIPDFNVYFIDGKAMVDCYNISFSDNYSDVKEIATGYIDDECYKLVKYENGKIIETMYINPEASEI